MPDGMVEENQDMQRNARKVDRIIIAVILLLVLGGVWWALMSGNGGRNGSQNGAAEPENPAGGVKTADDYNGKTLGIMTGSSFEKPTMEMFPDSDYLYYNNISDLSLALSQGYIDGFVCDEPVMRLLVKENKDIAYLPDNLLNLDMAFGLIKNTERSNRLREQFNEMMAEFESDGTLDELNDIWFGDDESRKQLDPSGLDGEEVRFVTNTENAPFSYLEDGRLAGYSIDLAYRFCERYGYKPVFDDAAVNAGIAGITAGKYDIFASALSVTEERKESMDFSAPIYNGGLVLVVRAEDVSAGEASLDDAVRSRPFSYYAENGKIGAITGGLYEVEILKRFPDAKVLQFNAQPDLAVALSEGKIDAFTCPVSSAKDFMAADDSLTYLYEVFMEIPYGFAFQKSGGENELRDQLNGYLEKIHSDGTYDAMVDIWFGNDESRKTVDIPAEGSRVLRYITASTMQPYSYIKDGQNAGLEIDIIAGFCREYGYGLSIDNADFGSLIAGVSSGTYDIASGTIMITRERAESVDFSDVYYTTDAVAVVRKETADVSGEDAGFLASVKRSFEKNFIRENRWQLIAEGIGTTCFITFFSTLFGTILAFLICMFRRTGSRLAGVISNIYVKLLQGTPLVVLLMILYYVVFGKSALPAVWVAVIGFTLNLGAYASEIMRAGIESIDGGQREAALALGYNENQAFFQFIFPQAAVRFLPVYNGEIVSLLKSTSIVGYIAVQDLTKMSDIIRSRTYEAFFPLIVTAVIYFILAWIISLLLKSVLVRISPGRKRG